jgi:hypothetical protein
MPRKQKRTTTSPTLLLDQNRCQFTTLDGRRCRMFRAKGHKSLCYLHGEQEAQILDAEAVAEELIGSLHKFTTAAELNRVLGNLFILIAQKRISRHDGALLGYVAQVLNNNVGSTLKSEMLRTDSEGEPAWAPNVRRALAMLQLTQTDSAPAGPPSAQSTSHPTRRQSSFQPVPDGYAEVFTAGGSSVVVPRSGPAHQREDTDYDPPR